MLLNRFLAVYRVEPQLRHILRLKRRHQLALGLLAVFRAGRGLADLVPPKLNGGVRHRLVDFLPVGA